MKLNLEKLNLSYKVHTETGIYLGTFQMDCDGFYYFWKSEDLHGAETSYNLRLIADKLDEVNKPFEKVIEDDFNKQFECEHNFVKDPNREGRLEGWHYCTKCKEMRQM